MFGSFWPFVFFFSLFCRSCRHSPPLKATGTPRSRFSLSPYRTYRMDRRTATPELRSAVHRKFNSEGLFVVAYETCLWELLLVFSASLCPEPPRCTRLNGHVALGLLVEILKHHLFSRKLSGLLCGLGGVCFLDSVEAGWPLWPLFLKVRTSSTSLHPRSHIVWHRNHRNLVVGRLRDCCA